MQNTKNDTDGQEDASQLTPSLKIEIPNREPVSVVPDTLADEQWAKYRDLCMATDGTVVFVPAALPLWSTDTRRRFFMLAHELAGKCRIHIAGMDHDNPFNAIVSCIVDTSDPDAHRQSLRAAAEAAAVLNSVRPEFAALAITQRLLDVGVPADQLESSIRSISDESSCGSDNPQGSRSSARPVLEHEDIAISELYLSAGEPRQSELIGKVTERLRELVAMHPREEVNELLQQRADMETQKLADEWQERYGEAFPLRKRDWLRLATEAGITLDDLRSGQIGHADILSIIEGYLMRARRQPQHASLTPSESDEGQSKAAPHSDPQIMENGYLGLTVDRNARVLRRNGVEVTLSRTEVGWHLFDVCFGRAGKQASIAEMEEGYPGGKPDERARRKAVNDVNKRLKEIGVRIENRRLIECPVTNK